MTHTADFTHRERRLLFVSAGDHHRLHRSVRANADFDVLVCYYGESRAMKHELSSRGFPVIQAQGGKFQNLWRLCQDQPALLGNYDAVLVLDDDLDMSASEIRALFTVRERYDLWIVQPAFDVASRISFAYSLRGSRTILRYTNFVEVGAPLFRRDKLQQFLAVYDGRLVGWGIDMWYMNVLGENEHERYAIADEVVCHNPPHRADGRREIDTLQPLAERRAAWETVRDALHLREVRPMYVGHCVRRKPIDQVASTVSSLAAMAKALCRSRRARGALLRNTHGRLVRLLRDIYAGLMLRWLMWFSNPNEFSTSALARARRAWGNLKWSASEMYVLKCVELSHTTQGSILECGSGFSTAVIGAAHRHASRQIISMEHDPEWVRRVRRRLRIGGLTNVKIVFAPLRRFGDFDWYDTSLEMEVPVGIGLVICDGPPGHTRGGRSGVVPVLRSNLCDRPTIILDDVDRENELRTAKAWASELGLGIELCKQPGGRSLAVLRPGPLGGSPR